MPSPVACRLCGHSQTSIFCMDQYYRCPKCDLIYLHPDFHISKEEEHKRYATHNNNPEDEHYRAFLNRVMEPMLSHLSSKTSGLDFGSGPGPTLSIMFEENGFNMSIYDPYFANEPAVLETQYDFVTATEVVEHFYTPSQSWVQLIQLTKPGGHIGIMTELVTESVNFENWYYKNDDTHVSFYSETTIHWIARHYSLEILHLDSRVILFRKKDTAHNTHI